MEGFHLSRNINTIVSLLSLYNLPRIPLSIRLASRLLLYPTVQCCTPSHCTTWSYPRPLLDISSQPGSTDPGTVILQGDERTNTKQGGVQRIPQGTALAFLPRARPRRHFYNITVAQSLDLTLGKL